MIPLPLHCYDRLRPGLLQQQARVPVGGCAVVLRVVAAEKARGDAVAVLTLVQRRYLCPPSFRLLPLRFAHLQCFPLLESHFVVHVRPNPLVSHLPQWFDLTYCP